VVVLDEPVIDDKTPEKRDIFLPSEKKAMYNVDLLIPFESDKLNVADLSSWSSSTQRFINYYAGVQMAIEDLGSDVGLNLRVWDSQDNVDELKALVRAHDFNDSDIILGPYDRDAIKWMSEWARDREITMVSPWISSTSITDDNPYYIQLKPGLVKHYETLLLTTKTEHSDEDVILVTKAGDERKQRYMDFAYQRLGGDQEQPHYTLMEFEPDTLTYGQVAFDTTFFKGDDCRKIFVVPYASSRDEGFVYDFLRKVQIEQMDCEVTIYGMYRWLEYQDQMMDLINAMDVRLTISQLTNPRDQQVRQFRKRYLSKYGTLPKDDALEGYDMMMYIGAMLKEHGNRFQFELSDKDIFTGLQTVYQLMPERDEDSGRVDYFENIFLDVIGLEGFRYKRISVDGAD
jgi:hypothetical protein